MKKWFFKHFVDDKGINTVIGLMKFLNDNGIAPGEFIVIDFNLNSSSGPASLSCIYYAECELN